MATLLIVFALLTLLILLAHSHIHTGVGQYYGSLYNHESTMHGEGEYGNLDHNNIILLCDATVSNLLGGWALQTLIIATQLLGSFFYFLFNFLFHNFGFVIIICALAIFSTQSVHLPVH